jgi:argininosuccinate synthase
MKTVLAYSGDLASAAATATLTRNHIDVVAVTLDLGQSDELDEIRARALAAGALRAHVIDARDRFARRCVLPVLQQSARIEMDTLAHPAIVEALLEVASIERADAVAIASTGTTFEAAIRRYEETATVLAPLRGLGITADQLREYASSWNLAAARATLRSERNLLIRPSMDPQYASDVPAHLTITLENGIPVGINDVSMNLIELIESLSLIAGQYGIGYGEDPPTPAVAVLRSVYGSARAESDRIRLRIAKGSVDVAKAALPETAMVAP